ncbi:MAG: lamin tail domain-containing protein, partial [Verrucomicrobiota bacterium]
ASSNHQHLVISEVMYHATGPEGAESGLGFSHPLFDFIEIQNRSSQTLPLNGLSFTEGIRFDFATSPIQTLAPGAHVVVVRSLAAFTNRYTDPLPIAGVFSGELNDGGERMTLYNDVTDDEITFVYNDGRSWPVSPDGAGHSLIPRQWNNQNNDALDYGGNWRASTYRFGSPGAADPAPFDTVLINEFAAHTDNPDTNNFPLYDSDDWIELFNTRITNINLGDWYLSDDADDLRKWAIPTTNTIGGNDWISFNETTGFHSPITTGFGLNKAGETVFLSYLPGTTADRVADAIRFKGQENDTTWGRFTDGEPGLYTLTPTRDAANALASTQRVVIEEVVYHPAPNERHDADNHEDEYVGLYNPNPFDITLQTEAGPWRLDGSVDYTFPSNTVLPAMSRILLVSFSPTNTADLNDFLYVYGLTNGQIGLYGPWSGRLDNRVGRVAVERPLLPDLIGESVSWVIVDEMTYFDREPWPSEADGEGASLHRIDRNLDGNDASNWAAGSPTPTSAQIGFVPKIAHAGTSGIGISGATAHGTLLNTGSAPATVSLYWGATDGEKNPTAWDASIDLGQPVVGPLSTVLTGLQANTSYAYRYRAVNIIGASWATGTAWFKTAGPPAVENAGVNVYEERALLQGHLINGSQADVTLYWGPVDGGTNTGAWQNALSLGFISEGSFFGDVSNLFYGVEYFFRAFASNNHGVAWASSSTPFKTLRPTSGQLGGGLNVRIYDTVSDAGNLQPIDNLMVLPEDASFGTSGNHLARKSWTCRLLKGFSRK